MKHFFTLFLCLVALAATPLAAQQLFPPLDTNYQASELRVSSTLNRDVLFEGNKDSVWNGSQFGIAKIDHDFTGLVPLGTGNDSVLLIVNHELRNNAKNPILGDGGGMTVFKAAKNANGRWAAVNGSNGKKYTNVDFSSVRGTYTNCAGMTLRNGRFITSEEVTPATNTDIASNFSDTSDYVIPSGAFKGRTIKAFQNYGWNVIVDAREAKAKYKGYAMGRSSYEGGWAMPDGKTVYLATDATPAPLLKFVADTIDNFEFGQLSFYKQGDNGVGGQWVNLGRSWDTVINVANIAIKGGATMFTRLEWIVEKNGKLYIAETGNDNASYKSGALAGGVPSFHFQRQDTLGGQPKDSTFRDFYGRVLAFDLTTNTIAPFLEGGNVPTKNFGLASPDGLALYNFDGKDYLVVIEDLNGTSQGRVGANGKSICEAFLLDLSIPNPTVNDLQIFVASSGGAELTGAVATPDGKTIFINNQHPSSSNTPPYNNGVTVAITGFSKTSPTTNVQASERFSVFPNPTSGIVNFNKTTDVALYTISGQQIRIARNVNSIDVSELQTGVYFLQNIGGEVVKIVKQ